MRRSKGASDVGTKEVMAEGYRKAQDKERERAELARKNITLPRLEWLERQKAREKARTK